MWARWASSGGGGAALQRFVRVVTPPPRVQVNRYSIARATVRDRAAVQLCRDLVEGIFGWGHVLLRMCAAECQKHPPLAWVQGVPPV